MFGQQRLCCLNSERTEELDRVPRLREPCLSQQLGSITGQGPVAPRPPKKIVPQTQSGEEADASSPLFPTDRRLP